MAETEPKIEHPRQNQSALGFSYPPSLFKTNPPNTIPIVGPVILTIEKVMKTVLADSPSSILK